VVVVDRTPPAPGRMQKTSHRTMDVLTSTPSLPPGRMVLAAGNSDACGPVPWRLVLDNAITTARVLPTLVDRDVVLVSSLEVHGDATRDGGTEIRPVLPLSDDELRDWCDRAADVARRPCPPWQAAPLCRELAEADPTGRRVYGMAKRAQELLVGSVVEDERLTVLRVGEVFGTGQDRAVARLIRRALVDLPLAVTDCTRTLLPVDDLATAILAVEEPGTLDAGLAALRMVDLVRLVLDELELDRPVSVRPSAHEDGIGIADTREFRRRLGGVAADRPDEHLRAALRAFIRRLRRESAPVPADGAGHVAAGAVPAAAGAVPAAAARLPVVIPPRPQRPDVVAARMQDCLESGLVKGGGRWTCALTDALRERLEVTPEHAVLATASGTAALKLAVVATAGPARPGDVAVLPSFTFMATGEALVQLGYRLRFCDVREDTWTLDADLLDDLLAPGDVRVVVAVDALGAPADYTALSKVCAQHEVLLVADSAPALGALWQGQPVGTQVAAHALSMSFAKVVSAGGGGGALVVAASAAERLRRPVDWTRSTQLSEIAAVAALDLVEHLDVLLERRRAVAAVYAEMAAVARLRPQTTAAGDLHAWVHWVTRVPPHERDRLATGLARQGLGTRPYYTPVLHTHDWAGHADAAGPLPVTDALAREVLALPMSSEMTPGQAEQVACAVLTGLGRERS
jgi:dTDP-4-amino-4,6-dideoxygalactose transaminase